MINKDPRFRVSKLSSHRWLFHIDNVKESDDGAYYLCQVSQSKEGASPNNIKHVNYNNDQLAATTSSSAISFSGGAKLNVLMPPKFVDQDTSPSELEVNEFDELTLHCKVTSEPRSSLVWKREDGKPISLNAQQTFLHKIEPKQLQLQYKTNNSNLNTNNNDNNFQSDRLISNTKAELYFNSTSRYDAGAYLVSFVYANCLATQIFARTCRCLFVCVRVHAFAHRPKVARYPRMHTTRNPI